MSFLAPFIIILLIIVFAVLFIGFTLLRGVLSIFFPFLRPKSRPYQGGNPFGQRMDDAEGERDEDDAISEEKKSRKKIFEKEDGEYVDFEEYKEKE